MRFQDIQQLCQKRFPNAGAILLDFAKAFDSVLWPALHTVLTHYGFVATVCSWIKTFYQDNLLAIMVNGRASKFFQLGSGVRQGDPLSPSIFVLFLESFMDYLRATTGHLGIPVQCLSLTQPLTAFADDCTGFPKISETHLTLWPRSKIMHKLLGSNSMHPKLSYLAFKYLLRI